MTHDDDPRELLPSTHEIDPKPMRDVEFGLDVFGVGPSAQPGHAVKMADGRLVYVRDENHLAQILADNAEHERNLEEARIKAAQEATSSE